MAELCDAFPDLFPTETLEDALPILNRATDDPAGFAKTLVDAFVDGKARTMSQQEELRSIGAWIDGAIERWTDLCDRAADIQAWIRAAPHGVEPPDLGDMAQTCDAFKRAGNDAKDLASAKATEAMTKIECKREETRETLDRLYKFMGHAVGAMADSGEDGGTGYDIDATCPVCYEKPVEVCLVPCGHTVCQVCSFHSNLRVNCPVCRMAVRERVRIYFS